jgi:hypothetical protein
LSDAEIRDWARERGEDVTERGPIPKALRARYELAHGFNEADGPTDADFDVTEPGPPPADITETRPRAVATPRKTAGWFGRGKQKGKPAGKRKARVPLDDTIAFAWRLLGAVAKPLPATSRLLKIQADAAGRILEPALKDTLADRILQPFARVSHTSEAVAVLVVPPAVITAMQLNPQTIPFLMPVLRESLMRMVKVAGPAMAEGMRAEREFEAEFGGTVDDLIALLLSDLIPAEGQSPEQAEADLVRRAQEAMSATVAA